MFDSSTGFSLPNGADRSPEAAWVDRSPLEGIAPDPNQFLPLAPDFVLALHSATDKLATLQRKMEEYPDCGVRLGRPTEYLNQPAQLSGEAGLPGFLLTLAEIWG